MRRAGRGATVLVGLTLVCGCSMPTSERRGPDASCARTLPVRVEVNGATAASTIGAAPGTAPLAPGQLAVHVPTSAGVVEVRYPPDRRPLEAVPAHADATVALLGAVARSGDGRTSGLGPAAGGPSIVTLATREPFGTRARPCDRVQVRYLASDGRVATVAFREDTAAVFDVGGLVESAAPTEVDTALAIERSVECGPRDVAYRRVDGGDAAASPGEALRAFLATDAARPLDVPTPPRPYRSYRVALDGTYRFERYTNWDAHEAVTVVRSGTGWRVAGYSIDRCGSNPAG